jgi:exodeoxyribonuclease VII small subunit
MTDNTKDVAAAGPGSPVEELSYTDASRELDEIVRFFEQRDVDVDQLVGRLVRATALVEELDRRLRQTRMQVEQLVPRLAAVLSDGAPAEPPPAGGATQMAGGREDEGGHAARGAGSGTPDDDEDLGDLDEENLVAVGLAETEDEYPDPEYPYAGTEDRYPDPEDPYDGGDDLGDGGTTPGLF